jgi:hypothetical protein
VDKDKQLEFLRKLQELKAKGIKSEDYTTPLESDRNLVRGLPEAPEPVTRISGSTPKIDTKQIAPILSGQEFTDKISKLKALRAAGKKVAGVIPFAGAGMAALSGDPAMAAEELAQDAMGPAGLAYEAIRPSDSGNVEEEKMMLAERDALEKYKKSPARLAKLKALMEGNNE